MEFAARQEHDDEAGVCPGALEQQHGKLEPQQDQNDMKSPTASTTTEIQILQCELVSIAIATKCPIRPDWCKSETLSGHCLRPTSMTWCETFLLVIVQITTCNVNPCPSDSIKCHKGIHTKCDLFFTNEILSCNKAAV